MPNYIQAPDFPVIAWQYTLASNVTISVTYNAVTFNGTIAAGDYWGFGTNTSGAADLASLMGALAAEVQDVLTDGAKFNIAGAKCLGYYEWSSGNVIALRGKLTVSGFVMATDVEVDITTEWTTFGSDGTSPDFDITSATGVGYGDFNLEGYFSPYNKTVHDERNYQSTVFSSESISGDSTSVIKWGTDKTRRVISFPTVYAAYVYAYRAGDTGFTAPANRDADDPNNLLENLRNHVIETSSDRTVRVYQDDGEYRPCRIIKAEHLLELEPWIEDISARGAMFSVNIPMLDLETPVGGAT